MISDTFVFGAEHCQSFANTLSSKVVLFNDDADRFVVLHSPSHDELHALLARYTQQRINDLWGAMSRVTGNDENLPDDVAFEAGNLLSSRLIQAATSNGVDLSQLLSGEVQLRDLTVTHRGQPISLLEDLELVLEAVASANTLGVAMPLLNNTGVPE